MDDRHVLNGYPGNHFPTYRMRGLDLGAAAVLGLDKELDVSVKSIVNRHRPPLVSLSCLLIDILSIVVGTSAVLEHLDE